MMNSLWYSQTPNRVKNLIKVFFEMSKENDLFLKQMKGVTQIKKRIGRLTQNNKNRKLN